MHGIMSHQIVRPQKQSKSVEVLILSHRSSTVEIRLNGSSQAFFRLPGLREFPLMVSRTAGSRMPAMSDRPRDGVLWRVQYIFCPSQFRSAQGLKCGRPEGDSKA